MKQFQARTALAAATMMFFAAPAFAQSGDYCTLPGEMVSEDAAGDARPPAPLAVPAPNPVPGYDALAVFIAEPASADGVDKVHVTLKVDSLSAVPNTVYFVRFNTSDGVERFFAYNPVPVPSNPATDDDPKFYYGHIEVGPASNDIVTDGPTSPESAAADGTITWVLNKDLLAGFETGNFVDSVLGEVNFVSGPFGIGFYFPVDETPGGAYGFRGNSSCAGKDKSGVLGILGAGGLPSALLMLLAMAALFRGAGAGARL